MARKKMGKGQERHIDNPKDSLSGQDTAETKQNKTSSKKISPLLQKQYIDELHELISVFPKLDFLKQKVTDLDSNFELKDMTACYHLAINIFRDLLTKQETEIRELKREQEKFKIRTKLLMEELMLPTKSSNSSLTTLQPVESTKKISEKKEAIEELERNCQRLKMDFDNLKRRTNHQIEQLTRLANEKLIMKLLPILDNFNLAVSSIPSDNNTEAYRQGVVLIKRQVEDLLEKEGLIYIEANGVPFNPKYHEAFAHEETDSVPEDTVLEEVRKGYCLGEKVIRPSLVKVAKPAKNSSTEQTNNNRSHQVEELSEKPHNGGNETI